jgi:hypothetical protein
VHRHCIIAEHLWSCPIDIINTTDMHLGSLTLMKSPSNSNLNKAHDSLTSECIPDPDPYFSLLRQKPVHQCFLRQNEKQQQTFWMPPAFQSKPTDGSDSSPTNNYDSCAHNDIIQLLRQKGGRPCRQSAAQAASKACTSVGAEGLPPKFIKAALVFITQAQEIGTR